MKSFYCGYCELSFYTHGGMAMHYLKEHYYNSSQNLTYCPLCHFFSLKIYIHMSECHSNVCHLCAQPMTVSNAHSQCEKILEKKKREYLNCS
jgi:hypothetical protein